MGWMAAAVIGSSLLGASSAESAASTQAAAADRAGELQQQQFERQVQLQAPFREAGMRALPELEAASRYTPFGAFTDNSSAAGTLANNLLPQYMGIYEALANGQDWKGKKIQGGLEARGAEAGKQFLGGAIPFFSPLTNIAANEGDAKAKVRKQIDPFMFTQPKEKKAKEVRRKANPYGGGSYGSSYGGGGYK